MAVKRKIPKLQTELDLQRFVPREIKQLKFFTPKGFAQQTKQTISREVSFDKQLVPAELRQLKKLAPKAIIKQVKQELDVKQKAAIGIAAVVAQEAPILFALMAKRGKKQGDDTTQLLFKAKTQITLVRKIKEGSLTSKKEIKQIVDQQTKAFESEKEKEQKQIKKPGIVESIIKKPLSTAATVLTVGAAIALYGPMVWPFVKGFLGELIPGLIREGLMGLTKPMRDFVDLFVSKKPADVFQQIQDDIERVSEELSAAAEPINSIKSLVEKQQKEVEQSTKKSEIDTKGNVGSIAETMKKAKEIEADGDLAGSFGINEGEQLEQPDKQPPKPEEPAKPAEPVPQPSPPVPEQKPQSAATEPPPAPAPAPLPPPAPEPPPAPKPVPVTPVPVPAAPVVAVEPKKPTVAAAPAAPSTPAPAPQPEQKPAVAPSNLSSVVTMQSGVSIEGMNQTLEQKVAAMASDFKQKTGKSLLVTSGVRSNEKQKELWDAEVARVGDPAKAKKKVAEPMPPLGEGKGSLHLHGLAIDINSRGAGGLNVLAGTRENSTGWLESFGLVRPVKKEDWHIQLANTPATPDNPYQPGKPLVVPDQNGGGTNVATGERINGLSAETSRMKNEPKQQTRTVVVQTTQTRGLVAQS